MAIGVVDDHRALLDGPRRECDIWLADHRQPISRQYARIGVEKGAFPALPRVLVFLNARSARFVHVALNAEDIFFIGVLHHRHEQAPIERHGDTDVDLCAGLTLVPSKRAFSVG